MELSPPREAAICADIQKLPSIWWSIEYFLNGLNYFVSEYSNVPHGKENVAALTVLIVCTNFVNIQKLCVT
jgi:hypothetical protein